MSVATLRYERHSAGRGRRPSPRAISAATARVELAFAQRRAATVLADLYQRSPCRVLFPRPAPGEPPLAVLLNTSGGLAGGDRIAVAVTVGAGRRRDA